MNAMRKSASFQEHVRTTFRYSYAVGVAKFHGLFAHGSTLSGTVHPDPGDAQFCAFVNHSLGFPRWSHKEHTVYLRLHYLQALKAILSLQFLCEQVHWNDVISATTHLAKQFAAEVPRITRNAHHCDTTLRQEIVDVGSIGAHEDSPLGGNLLFVSAN
jgi:hypothetical protein